MTNKERFLSMASGQGSDTMDRLKWRSDNREWLNHSRKIALMVLEALKEQRLSQKQLAEKMNVSPQMVNKWVKGSENLTIETISKLERALGIAILNLPKSVQVLDLVVTTIVTSQNYSTRNRRETNVKFPYPLQATRVRDIKEKCNTICVDFSKAS
jgi:transcriptional regulator with XRE-family HTH domain